MSKLEDITIEITRNTKANTHTRITERKGITGKIGGEIKCLKK